MMFSDIVGNEEVKRALAGMVDRGKVPHALMFYENEGCGALAIALAFLQYLICRNHTQGDSCGSCPSCNKVAKLIHPDVHFIFPVASGSKVGTDKPTSASYMQYWRELVLANPFFLEDELSEALGIESKSALIAVAEARGVIDALSFSALEGGWRCIVVYLPEKMNADTANRLLKSIEEPPEMTQFVFITHAPEKVLTTISSRCQGVRILPLSKQEVAQVLVDRFGIEEQKAIEAAANSGGSVGRALRSIADSEETSAEYELFTSLMEALMAKDLPSALDVGESIAGLSSREKTKAFCRFASDGLRKIFLIQQGLPQLAALSAQEKSFYESAARRCRPAFARNALAHLDRTVMLIERNVNIKILICDLIDRLFLYI